MKALVFHNVGDIRYEENWPDPKEPGAGEVTIATSWCGICGSDMEDYERGGVIPVDAPHPISGKKAPLVLGHEYSGVVAKVGEGVTSVKVGQKVAVECVVGCGVCYYCKRQKQAMCENLISVGQQDDGGMADFFNVPAENCIPLPEGMSEDIAALAEPLAVMVRAMNQARFKMGETIAIIGAGAIGLAGVGASLAAGAEKVIVIAHGGKRAEVAQKIGATHILNSRDEGWLDEYYTITGGRGADVVMDTGGNVNAMRLAVEITRRSGRCVYVSVVDADIPIPGLDVMLHEKEIIGSVAHSVDEEFKWALQYLADGRIDLSPMVTSRIHLKDALELGIKKLQSDRSQIKILVTPHEEYVK